MTAITVPEIKKITIQLYGLFGTFKIPDTRIEVKYFETKASPLEPSSGEYALLKELKPMRERIEPNKLSNLSSLLQRDLNDARVASELVPYLLGKSSQVAFFPAILAIMMPNGFLEAEEYKYPSPSESFEIDNTQVTKFGDYWTATKLKANEQYGPLGLLSIDSSRTDIIVLDGQHRANAFRYVSRLLDPQKRDIHSAFYENSRAPEKFSAELPVTLVWFEGQNIEPKLVSRNLFVDVNNTARQVSLSRNILLDDRGVTCLLTRFLYSALAEDSSFSAGNFSLLHSAFDLDTDVTTKTGNIATLTNPEIIDAIMFWLLFDYGSYNKLHIYSVKRDTAKKNPAVFEDVFKSSYFRRQNLRYNENTNRFELTDSKLIGTFEQEYRKQLHPVFLSLFSGFDLFRNHYAACKSLDQNIANDSMSEREAWRYVFKGGDGLYYTLIFSEKKDFDNERLQNIRDAVKSVESKFSKERAALFNDIPETTIDSAFLSVRSKAFQVGLFMALRVFSEELEIPLHEAADEFVNRLNSITPNNWIVVLTKVRQLLIKDVVPKAWPAYQKIIFRIIQENEQYYSNRNFQEAPDGQLFVERIRDRFDSWFANSGIEPDNIDFADVPEADIKTWSNDAEKFVLKLLTESGIPPLENVDYLEESKIQIKKRIQEFVSAIA